MVTKTVVTAHKEEFFHVKLDTHYNIPFHVTLLVCMHFFKVGDGNEIRKMKARVKIHIPFSLFLSSENVRVSPYILLAVRYTRFMSVYIILCNAWNS